MRSFRSITFAGLVIAVASASHFACVGDSPNATNNGGPSDDSGVATDTQTPPSDSGLASDAAPSVGCPLGCLPPAPAGWTGPSAVYDGPSGSKPAACPTTYVQKELEAFQDLDASAAVCNCGAASNTGAVCETGIVAYPGAECTGTPTFDGALTNAAPCRTITNEGYLKVNAATLTPGTCSYPGATTTLPDAGGATADVSCGLPQNAICTGAAACVATPVPDAPFTRLCIHQSGEVACPSVDYAQRFIAYTSLTDTRSCSACVGTASGGTCGAAWGIATTLGACMTTPPSNMAMGTCTATKQGINTPVGASIAPSGVGCELDGGAPDGSVAAVDPVTFCCNK